MREQRTTTYCLACGQKGNREGKWCPKTWNGSHNNEIIDVPFFRASTSKEKYISFGSRVK